MFPKKNSGKSHCATEGLSWNWNLSQTLNITRKPCADTTDQLMKQVRQHTMSHATLSKHYSTQSGFSILWSGAGHQGTLHKRPDKSIKWRSRQGEKKMRLIQTPRWISGGHKKSHTQADQHKQRRQNKCTIFWNFFSGKKTNFFSEKNKFSSEKNNFFFQKKKVFHQNLFREKIKK